MAKSVKDVLDNIDKEEKTVNTNSNLKKKPKKFIKPLLSLIITLYLIMNFVVSAYRIPTGSMEKSLQIGDMLLVNKFIYGFRTPDWFGIPFTDIGFDIYWLKFPFFKQVERGDVVVFKPPHEPKLHYVKRCVGVPGDVIEVKDKELYINGEVFNDFYDTLEDDPYYPKGKPKARFVDNRTLPEGFVTRDIFKGLGNRDNFGPVKVPEKHYFMMGDNRDNSLDSRYWGFVNEDYIVGKPIMVYFSYDPDVPLNNLFKGIRWERIGYFIQ